MAPGIVQVETTRKTIQHLEGGIIEKVLVNDGQRVAEGQPLLRLDGTKARATLDSLRGQIWDALAREARLQAERDGLAEVAFPQILREEKDPAEQVTVAGILAGQVKIFESRRSLLDTKIGVIRQRIEQSREEIGGLKAQEVSARRQLRLIEEEAQGVRQLVERGLERRPRLLQLERQQAEIEGKRGETIAAMAKANQTIAEAEIQILNQRNDTQNEVAEQLRETQKKLLEMTEQQRAAADVLKRIEVRSPVAGVVTDLKVHTRGTVVQPGEALLDVVPLGDRLIVEAQVKPDDIKAVRVGLPSQVRLTAYRQRSTPPLAGKVDYISADRMMDKHTNQPYYLARIVIDEAELAEVKKVELIAGMQAEVMIKTGETTVALYALSPIRDSFRNAFRDR
jgi:HlyD family secretion protein